MQERRIVITGIGPVTPVGIGLDDFWSNLMAGKSGISILSEDRTNGYDIKVKIGGEIKNFDINAYFTDPKVVKSMEKDMDKVSQFAVVATKHAVDNSKWDFDKLEDYGTDRTKVATFIGTGIGGIKTTCDDTMALHEHGSKRIGIRSIIRLMPNAASGHVGIIWGLKGRAKSDATACASGLDSLFDAFWYIKNGLADVMVAGGTEACLNSLAIASFANMTALSRRECAPQEASCPFDKRRDGFVMGEGACVFVLEELSVAQKRGAKIYAELVGVGASCDAYHITAPSEGGEGGARAMEMALDCAGISKNRECVDYIHAHGTSTPLNDARETAAIKKVFGEHAYKLCVGSTKSMTGHLIGAAGPVGMAVCSLAIDRGEVPPTINYTEPDPECDLDYIPNVGRKRDVNYAMVQALGFGGHNTVAVLKKFKA